MGTALMTETRKSNEPPAGLRRQVVTCKVNHTCSSHSCQRQPQATVHVKLGQGVGEESGGGS